MKITEKRKDGVIEVKVDEKMTIYNVAALKPDFVKLAGAGCDVVLDLSGVSKIDSAGYQLLSFLRRDLHDANKDLKIVSTSREVISLFGLYGETLN